MAKESAPILLKRAGRFLVPADALTEKFLESLPQGKTLRARDITQPRSRPRLRLYWALLHLVSENLTDVPSEALHSWLKVRLGLVVAIPLRSGKIDYVPGSIAFSELSEEEFAPYLDRVIDLLCNEIIPGLGKQDLLDMAREMTGEK
jgi:hypothetical protein